MKDEMEAQAFFVRRLRAASVLASNSSRTDYRKRLDRRDSNRSARCLGPGQALLFCGSVKQYLGKNNADGDGAYNCDHNCDHISILLIDLRALQLGARMIL